MSGIFYRRRNSLFLLILMLLSVSLWLPRLKGPLDLRWDGGVYYTLGKSLEEGKGYRLLNEPGEIKAVQYPPLLPLIAAGHIYLMENSHPSVAGHSLRLFFAAIFIGYIIAVHVLCRLYLSPGFAFLATLIVLLHIHTTWLSDLFFAELPFAFISILFLIISKRKDGQPKELMMAVLGGIAYLLRSVGIALLAAWVGESLLQRNFKRAAIRIVLACIPVLAWQSYISLVKSGDDYKQPAYEYQRAGYQFYNVGYLKNIGFIDPFVPENGKLSPKLLANRILKNIGDMPVYLGEAISSKARWARDRLDKINKGLPGLEIPMWVVDVWLALFGLGALCGMVLLGIKSKWTIPLYVVSTIALISVTPWPGQFERYLAPLTPLLALGLFITLSAIWQRLSKISRWQIHYASATGIAVLLISVFVLEAFPLYKIYYKYHSTAIYQDEYGKEHKYRLFFYPDAWKQHDSALEWLESNAKPEDIIVTSTPHWAYLKTGLRAIMPPFEPDVREAQRLIDSVPAIYLVLDSLDFVDITKRYAEPLVLVSPNRWEMVYSSENNHSRIFRRLNKTEKTVMP
jgi:hypothetical protein